MTIFKRIKETITALDAAQMYGLNVRSNGMTNRHGIWQGKYSLN